MRLLIKNGRILDPAEKTDRIYDLLVEDGKIIKIEKEIMDVVDCVFDASNCFVMPGLIDLHVHLREPGYEYKETIKTGAMAAARGGFTTICPMPNTTPSTDSPEKIAGLIRKASNDAVVNVLPIGAITIGQIGGQLADISGMKHEGAVGISEDGKSVMNTALYREAMEEAAKHDIVVMAHCEDRDLVGQGVMNQSSKSEALGLLGITNAVEDVIVARDLLLAKETRARLHLCHCSTKASIWMLKQAKEQGILATAEVCPHHFTLSDEDILEDDGKYKMNPPLRSRDDVQALKEGIRDGIVDTIATDHAPHGEEEKKGSMKQGPFGIVGLETAVPLTITELLEPGYLSPMRMAELMSYNPAKILGIDRGTLGIGAIADITIIDPKFEYKIDMDQFLSKGKNTPFHGRVVRGIVVATIVSGKIVYEGETR